MNMNTNTNNTTTKALATSHILWLFAIGQLGWSIFISQAKTCKTKGCPSSLRKAQSF